MSPLEPVVRVWGTVLPGTWHTLGPGHPAPCTGRGCGEGTSQAVRSCPRAQRGCLGAVGHSNGGEPCPPPRGASAGAAPSPRVAALQPDRAGAGRGSAGCSMALPESPSARHLPHAQHSLPWVRGMCHLPHPASRLPAAWPTGAPRPEETAPSIFRPRPRAHGAGQQCQSRGEPPRGCCLGCS